MKQVFCDINRAAEEKSVEIRVRFSGDNGVGLRRHFCPEQYRVVGVEAYGLHEDAPLFCPLCGGLTTLEAPSPTCRRGFLSDHYGLIEPELRDLCEELTKRSQKVRARLETIQSDINLAHALLDDLTTHKRDVEHTFGSAPVGYVYAITDGRAIKIGWTARHPGLVGGRLAQLQTATQNQEAELHGKFQTYHIRGEWFRYVPEIVEHFDRQ
jgi:hypothetical protein